MKTILMLLVCLISTASAQFKIEDISPVVRDENGKIDIPFSCELGLLNVSHIVDFAETQWSMKPRYYAPNETIRGVEQNPIMQWGFRHRPMDVVLLLGGISGENVLLKYIYSHNRSLAWIATSAILITSCAIIYKNCAQDRFHVKFDFAF